MGETEVRRSRAGSGSMSTSKTITRRVVSAAGEPLFERGLRNDNGVAAASDAKAAKRRLLSAMRGRPPDSA
jgi:hypothetical protein